MIYMKQKAKTAQAPINWCTHTENLTYPCNGILLSHNREWSIIHTRHRQILKPFLKKRARDKDHIQWYDSMSAAWGRQEPGLPSAAGGKHGKQLLVAAWFSFSDENALKWNMRDRCKILQKPLTCTFESGKSYGVWVTSKKLHLKRMKEEEGWLLSWRNGVFSTGSISCPAVLPAVDPCSRVATEGCLVLWLRILRG